MTRRAKRDTACGAMRPQRPVLPDDVVDEAKRAVIHGVGYKRLPADTRFKKGQSGNPKGRPKASNLPPEGNASVNRLILREAERPINVREGGEIRQMPAIEAVLRAQYATATKGSAYAQKHILQAYGWAERERRREIVDSISFWEWYIATSREAIAAAERRGEEPPSLLPHPDDVVIDPDKGVRIPGPVTQEEVTKLDEACRMRDVLLMQEVLDRRHADGRKGDDASNHYSGTALLFATLLNQMVPPRFQLADTQMALRLLDCRSIPKRQLLKDLYRGWRALGAPARRGFVFPPWWIVKQRLDQVGQALVELEADEPATFIQGLAWAVQEAHDLNVAGRGPAAVYGGERNGAGPF